MKILALILLSGLFGSLLTLKLTGAAPVRWWLVLAPIYGYPLALVVIVTLLLTAGLSYVGLRKLLGHPVRTFTK